MEIKDGVVVLSEDEVSRTCPADIRWAVSQVRAYGVDVVSRSEKLARLLRCTAVLKKAGVPFRIEPAKVVPEALKESPAESSEVEGPALVEKLVEAEQ